MPISDRDTMVSIQVAGSPDPVAGHLRWGVLWDRDIVLVPDPLDWLDDRRLEVLLARGLDDDHAEVVRISPRSIAVIGPTDHPEGLAAMVRLAGPVFDAPRYAIDPGRLQAHIEDQHDVWSALVAQGVVPLDLRTKPADDLAVIAEWEARQQLDLVRDLRQRTFRPDWPNPLCILSPWCIPGGPFIPD